MIENGKVLETGTTLMSLSLLMENIKLGTKYNLQKGTNNETRVL